MAYFFALSRGCFLTKIKPNSANICMFLCICLVISDTLGYASCATFLFLPRFEVISDLLLERHTAKML